MSGNTIIGSTGIIANEGWYVPLQRQTEAFARQTDLSVESTVVLHQLVRSAILLERRRCSLVGRLAQLESKLADKEILKEPAE